MYLNDTLIVINYLNYVVTACFSYFFYWFGCLCATHENTHGRKEVRTSENQDCRSPSVCGEVLPKTLKVIDFRFVFELIVFKIKFQKGDIYLDMLVGNVGNSITLSHDHSKFLKSCSQNLPLNIAWRHRLKRLCECAICLRLSGILSKLEN